ncbi:type 4a pilus biogenesis protein PilO [Cryptosporangium aurantiacum]|uniref:Tfp pilus assembly protein PilO n=1 Tax=Cryptosporangium aurantiacum TaxID=134849 RepID=A0A1M7PTW9_9ACTN|nr:type 4a pilus biogenesis protein PilO [Cryptosporangium aurantiacum]SHN20933.1 Tfp pilus assembly protein PilO [Cryptosporangium aurantiacum]
MALSQMTTRVPSGLLDTSALRGNVLGLWVIGGVVGTLLVLALGGFLLIRPQQAHTAEVRAQTETAQASVDALRSRLAQVRAQNSRIAEYRSAYQTARAALPTTAALSTFLRSVQSSGSRAGVAVSGLIVGAPSQVNGLGATIYALPITITATGTASKLDGFLNQLQRVQPRAVLVSTANATPNESSNSLRGSVLLTLGLQMYVAPAAAASTD